MKKLIYDILNNIKPVKLKCVSNRKLERIKFDSSIFEYLENIKNDITPSLSAIYRVKNGATTIKNSILSISPICNEVIVIDNGSTDETMKIVGELQNELKGICDVKIHTYNNKLALAGDGYIDRVKNDHSLSLAKYYNYAFSLGTSEYLLKCDAHCIYVPCELINIQKVLKKKPKVIYYRGCEIYGKKLNFEPYIFRKDSGYEYVDDLKYEKLIIKDVFLNKIKYCIFRPAFIHVKRISYISMINKKKCVSELYK